MLEQICQSLPVFPLPNTVLLPGEVLPLHVFEPRYRDLVKHCLDGDGVLGIATLRPGFEPDYADRPPIHPEVGIGRLVQHQAYPDGRCNILVEYVGRMRVEDEHAPQHSFREVKGALLADDPTGAEASVQRLQVLVLQLGAVSPEAGQEAKRLVELDGMEMVDSLARKLLDRPDDRRAYLALDRLADRVAVVEQRLSRFLLATMPSAEA